MTNPSPSGASSSSAELVGLFGYGSLLFRPELPEAIVARPHARLLGHHRCFNIRSISRHCRRRESYDAFPEASPETFFVDEGYRSLVLGTAADPQGGMEGRLLLYPAALGEELWAITDRREGYYPGDRDGSGYLRRDVVVELADGQRRACQTYLANPNAAGGLFLPPAISLSQRARILINATPRRPTSDDRALESRGLFYLEGVREDLRQDGIVDEHLEALAAAVREEEGPWRQLVTPPQG